MKKASCKCYECHEIYIKEKNRRYREYIWAKKYANETFMRTVYKLLHGKEPEEIIEINEWLKKEVDRKDK